MKKVELRTTMRTKRKTLTHQQVQERSSVICERVLESAIYKNAKTVMVYMASFGEVDLAPLIDRALSEQKKVVVPISNREQHTIRLSYIEKNSILRPGAYGILEPEQEFPAKIQDVDLILVPGIAYDRNGGRIGFGQGYYDRFLEQVKALKVAVCYDFQLVPDACAEAHDVSMDYIVTESEMIVCA